MIETRAFVISTLKYGDSSLIVKCFTEQLGTQSFLLKGILATRKGKVKPAFFQYMTLLEFNTQQREKDSLGYMRDVRVLDSYHQVQQDHEKRSVLLLIAEMLAMALQEEDRNQRLFHFLEYAMEVIQNHPKIANFHLVFLLQLSQHLGFYPDREQEDLPYFDLQEGNFTAEQPFHHFLAGQELEDFRSLLGTDFDALEKVKLTKDRRSALLAILIRYFQLHLPWFKKPRSVGVLQEIFK